jgi:cellulose synthase/poly-beta-1,6-N-acetylglucosamine synthase-like glycosyltransferase
MEKEPLKDRNILVFISAYNEEINIAQTIHSIFSSTRSDSIEGVIIGDDGSQDATIDIIQDLKKTYPNLALERFSRLGKPAIINALVEKYLPKEDSKLLVFMDANITMDSFCLEHLINQIQHVNVSMVGASVIPKDGAENVEAQYILRENRIKAQESTAIGYVIGVFGACYMMRGENYQSLPTNFITDDLYQTMSVVRQGKYILYSEDAKVYETMTAQVENEFKRKSRYAAGNFQILFHFITLLNPNNSSWGFVYCYFFHKIIRWLSPILFLGVWVLSFFNLFGQYSNILMQGGVVVCLFLCINFLLSKWKLRPIGYRIYYFISMNLAILYGFFNYIKGIKSNVWERSDRI